MPSISTHADRPSTSQATPIRSRKLAEHIGREIVDFDLRLLATGTPDPWLLFQIKDALAHARVLLLRGQSLRPDEISAVARHWGPLMDVRQAGNGAVHIPGNDYIKVISPVRDESGRRLGDGNSEAQIWHVDASYWEAPPGVTIFYAQCAPSPPPKTMFMDMVKVYASLPEATKARIAKLRVIHHQYPRGVEAGIDASSQSLPLATRLAGRAHPLVRRHLATGEPLLFLPFRRDCIVEGWNESDSRALLEALWRHAWDSPCVGAIGLEAGDVAIWDNTGVTHRREGWNADSPRIMWHLTAAGEVPTPMYQEKVVNINALGYDGKGDPGY